MNYAFNSEVREKTGKNKSHQLRDQGLIPAVIYGMNMSTLPIQMNTRELEDFIRIYGDGSSLVSLNIGGSMYTVVLKEIQKDPMTGRLLHVDFQQVSQNDKIQVHVPLVLKGRSMVEKSGSIIQQQLRDIEIECSAGNIPTSLEFDISHFRPGDTLKVADMEFGEEISIIADPESIIASVAFSKQEIADQEIL